MNREGDVKQALLATLKWAKEENYSRYDIEQLVKQVYSVRFAAGMEVTDGWEMPKPPREGLIPCFQLDGGDGMSLFWWDEKWGKWPDSGRAFAKSREEAWTWETHGCVDAFMDTDPLVNPDTGGCNYKQTEEALRELGFNG